MNSHLLLVTSSTYELVDRGCVMMRLWLLSLQSSMLVCDKMSRAHELHKVCRSYPEPVLTAAFESLKTRGLVTHTKTVNTDESFYSYSGHVVRIYI